VCEKVNGLKKALAKKENDIDKEIEAAESVVENLEKVVEALTAATANAVAEMAKAKKSSDGLVEEQQAEEAREEEGGEGHEPEHVADPEIEADAVGDSAVEQAFRNNAFQFVTELGSRFRVDIRVPTTARRLMNLKKKTGPKRYTYTYATRAEAVQGAKQWIREHYATWG